ncbi:MAG: DinB family protein [Dehalococcoidia bacterium]
MTDIRPGMTDAERLEATVDELAARLTALPEASFTQRTQSDAWTAAEVVGHMTELLPYWAGVAVSVAAAPGTPFGRTLDDPDRVGAVAAANEVARGESLAHLRHATHEAAQAIRAFDATQWDSAGMHPTNGSMTVGAIVQQLIVDHAIAHTHQALVAAGAGQAD